MYRLESFTDGFNLFLDDKLIISHSINHPAFYLGKGQENIKMFRGNFYISDNITDKVPLNFVSASKDKIVFSHPNMVGKYEISLSQKDDCLHILGKADGKNFNRLFLRIVANENEHITGGGEQFSALDLRGRTFPIWTREQGVGRNKQTEITKLANELDGSGGDYHTTFFPQPTFISSRMYFAHLENYSYCELNFTNKDFHELSIWDTNISLIMASGENYSNLLYKLTALLGRQPELPDWAMKGMWLGVQGGTERALFLRNKCRKGGMDVSAVWIQDWEGKRITSFGKRLQWDWRWNKELYPNLDKVICGDKETAWMGYINPYLVDGGVLFSEAQSKGFFVKNSNGEDYLFDFGEYNCGVVDLTMPQAFDWYKDVIKTNLIGMGFKGWMADFGEYLPADAVCFGGSGLEMHNKWPMLWAKCNRLAVEECGKLGQCVFFMRAGAAGSGKYSTLTWAGDQCVDWSLDDGLPSVITAALSLGMSGYGLHTCDAGGYTTLFHLHRDKELLLRWLEFACFTPIIRTHEGNRPDSNIQIYSEEDIISCSARLINIHNALLPYLKECVKENSQSGIPVMRPLFLEAPNCDRAYERDNFTYMLGGDLLVAPVIEPKAESRTLWLPDGKWIHLWTGNSYIGGEQTVPAPIGKTPVFYKCGSKWTDLFEKISNDYK